MRTLGPGLMMLPEPFGLVLVPGALGLMLMEIPFGAGFGKTVASAALATGLEEVATAGPPEELVGASLIPSFFF